MSAVATVRVAYGDTDQMGVVYYANYLRYFEVGREKLDVLSVRIEQHIGENRNRVLALDDSLKKLQFSQ